jgi:HSP20 family molecular chaperone IbpA
MPEQPARAPEDEEPRDSTLYELARGVGALVNLVTNVAGAISTAVNQPRLPAARPVTFKRPLPAAPRVAPLAREPIVDLFDEGEEIVVVLEWPDGDVGALGVDVQDDVLAIALGNSGSTLELLLPAVVDPASLRLSARNGIAAIRMRRV